MCEVDAQKQGHNKSCNKESTEVVRANRISSQYASQQETGKPEQVGRCAVFRHNTRSAKGADFGSRCALRLPTISEEADFSVAAWAVRIKHEVQLQRCPADGRTANPADQTSVLIEMLARNLGDEALNHGQEGILL